MSEQKKPCLICLLDKADEEELYRVIRERLSLIPAAQKACGEEYSRRLSLCEGCAELSDGVCRKCGCYVLLRAARQSSRCPHEKPRW